MPDKFKNIYRISSARLQNWDYGSNASYFITICSGGRDCFFGKIENDLMHLSQQGKIALDCWQKIPEHFPYMYLDEFTVMPNHIHGIIVIHDLSKHFHIDQNKIDDDFVETIFNRSIQFVRILDSIDYITKRLNLLTTQRL